MADDGRWIQGGAAANQSNQWRVNNQLSLSIYDATRAPQLHAKVMREGAAGGVMETRRCLCVFFFPRSVFVPSARKRRESKWNSQLQKTLPVAAARWMHSTPTATAAACYIKVSEAKTFLFPSNVITNRPVLGAARALIPLGFIVRARRLNPSSPILFIIKAFYSHVQQTPSARDRDAHN